MHITAGNQQTVGFLSVFLSTAFPDTQLSLALLFLIPEKFALCCSSPPALQSRSRGCNSWSISDYLSQKTQSLLKIKATPPLGHVNPRKFLSTDFVREEVLPHFTSSEGPIIWGGSTLPVAHAAGDSCLARSQVPVWDAAPSPSQSPAGRSIFLSAFVNLSIHEPTQTSVFADVPITVHCEVNGSALV